MDVSLQIRETQTPNHSHRETIESIHDAILGHCHAINRILERRILYTKTKGDVASQHLWTSSAVLFECHDHGILESARLDVARVAHLLALYKEQSEDAAESHAAVSDGMQHLAMDPVMHGFYGPVQ